MSNSGTVTYGEYSASYEVTKGMVKVTSSLGVKHAQLGRTPAELLARMMLREQVEAAGRTDGG